MMRAILAAIDPTSCRMMLFSPHSIDNEELPIAAPAKEDNLDGLLLVRTKGDDAKEAGRRVVKVRG